MPERIQRKRTAGWRMPDGAIYVGRPTKWGNPFGYRTRSGLARVPAAVGDGPWEYEERITVDGARHDYHHPGGRITVCHVRYMTLPEIVETYRRALTGDLTPSMRSALPNGRWLGITVDDVRRELAGRDLTCWCPLPKQGAPDICHAAVLLELAGKESVNA